MPASSPTLLLTRPQAQAERFAAACRERLGDDLPVVISPLMSIRHIGADVDLEGIAAIIATSSNGIEALAQSVELAGRTAYCVGDATGAAASAAGMHAICAEGDAVSLIALLRDVKPRGTLLYARGAEVRTDIAAVLSEDGITVRSVVMYDQRAIGLNEKAAELLRGSGPIALPLFSPRSAVLATEALAPYAPALRIAAISKAVAEAWTGPPPEALAIARRPDSHAMIDAVVHIFDGASS